VPDSPAMREGEPLRIAVRPEWLELAAPDAVPPGRNAVVGAVRDVIYLGETIHVVVAVAGDRLIRVALRNQGQLLNPLRWTRGEVVAVTWRPQDCQVLESA
jgi:ABC-type Fe3+/spermidine/putrescine transport system ATPase subunit